MAHVLAERDGSWIVFLSERGGESSPVRFESEHEACTHLLGRVAAELAERLADGPFCLGLP